MTATAVHYAFTWREDILDRLYKTVGPHVAHAVIVLSVGLAGLIAYIFKKVNQLLYGLSEVVFAGASAVHVAGSLTARDAMVTQWAALIGFAYLISRGLGNISEGAEKLADFLTRPMKHIE
jgi:hypothetical protein